VNGIDATRVIYAKNPEVRVIGLSMFVQADRADAMRQAGAVRYLTRSGPPEELLGAIRGRGHEPALDPAADP
jgi:DNA-binding NarL/FixJ family response regulator